MNCSSEKPEEDLERRLDECEAWVRQFFQGKKEILRSNKPKMEQLSAQSKVED